MFFKKIFVTTLYVLSLNSFAMLPLTNVFKKPLIRMAINKNIRYFSKINFLKRAATKDDYAKFILALNMKNFESARKLRSSTNIDLGFRNNQFCKAVFDLMLKQKNMDAVKFLLEQKIEYDFNSDLGACYEMVDLAFSHKDFKIIWSMKDKLTIDNWKYVKARIFVKFKQSNNDIFKEMKSFYYSEEIIDMNHLIIMAIEKGCTYTIDCLKFENFNFQDNNGNTPLMIAIANMIKTFDPLLKPYFEIALTLLNNGANVNIQNNEGLTAGDMIKNALENKRNLYYVEIIKEKIEALQVVENCFSEKTKLIST